MTFQFSHRVVLAVACGLVAVATSGCKQEVRFTEAPPEGELVDREGRPPTTVALRVPLDIAQLRARMEQIVGAELRSAVRRMAHAGCAGTVGSTATCTGTRVSLKVVRQGAISLASEEGRLAVVIPLAYVAESAEGGRSAFAARYGSTTARILLHGALAPGFAVVADVAGTVSVPAIAIASPAGAIDLAPAIADMVRPQAPALARVLAEALEAPLVRDTIEQAWAALYVPVAIAGPQPSRLLLEPVKASTMGFSATGGSLALRVGIASTVREIVDDTDAARPMRRAAVIEAEAPAATSTRMPLVATISSEPIRQAILAAFPKRTAVENATDEHSAPVRSRLRDVRLYPSYRRLCIELALDLIEPRRLAGRIGTAHLLAIPNISGSDGVLALDRIVLAERAKSDRLPGFDTREEPEPPRITAEPYASTIARVARLSVSREMGAILPRLNAITARPMAGGFALTASFGHGAVESVTPVEGGFRIAFELTGTLELHAHPPAALAERPVTRPAF